MKVCPLTRISSPAPEICPQCSFYWGCPLHGNNIPALPWPNRTHSHFGRQHPSGILGVYECESLAG